MDKLTYVSSMTPRLVTRVNNEGGAGFECLSLKKVISIEYT